MLRIACLPLAVVKEEMIGTRGYLLEDIGLEVLIDQVTLGCFQCLFQLVVVHTVSGLLEGHLPCPHALHQDGDVIWEVTVTIAELKCLHPAFPYQNAPPPVSMA